jgi:hypothetical protein
VKNISLFIKYIFIYDDFKVVVSSLIDMAIKKIISWKDATKLVDLVSNFNNVSC